MEIKIDTKLDNKYSLIDSATSGYFEIEGAFKNWNSLSRVPDLIYIELKNIFFGKYFNISLVEYCFQNKTLEIHIEEVRDPRNKKTHYEYFEAINEKLKFLKGDKIIVSVLLYNSDPLDPEQEYLRCGKFDGMLNFPIPAVKAAILPSVGQGSDRDDGGFGPKVKKGNILIGN